jgi:gliding motility-associated-like protein
MTDFFGCTVMNTYLVNQPSPVVPSVVGFVGPNCANPTGGSIDLSVSGGIPNYTYLWNNGQVVQDPQSLAQGTYTVTVTDSKGCTKTSTATVTGDFAPPTSVATTTGSLSCSNLVVTLDGAGSSVGNNFTYNWLAPPGGGIVSGGQTLTPIVNKGGTYTIVVTNTANGCTSTATTVVNSTILLPTTNAGINQTLTCVQTNVNLDGSASSTGANFTYLWTASNGGTIIGGETTLNPVVSTSGDYTLVVTNTSNGCTSSDVASVITNTTAPNANVAVPSLLTCTNTVVALSGNGSTPAANLTYLWTTSNGNIQGSTTSSSANAIEAGLYTLIVTNTTNGCTDQESVTVNQDNSVPTANANVPSGLDCNTTQLTINGGGSSTGANFTFQWTSSTGSGFISGQNTLNPTINAPANYTLLVTNTLNNCTASASVLINQDNQLPAANAGQPATLTCATTTVVLGDPTALIAPNLTYTWTGTGITGGGNTPTPTVNQLGTYNLVVTNTTNGCVSTATVAIGQNIQAPTAIVGAPGQLNCTTPAVQLSGTGSSTGPAFSYDWVSSTGGGIGAGGTTLTPTVTAAGTYTLIVTNNANGCTQTASATVGSNANLPTALATPQGVLTCAVQQISVNAAGSSSGSNFSYTWGTLNGQISSGQGTPSIMTGTPGTYTLLVTNTGNNCTASFSVDVLADLVLPAANAGLAQTLNCTQPSLTLDGAASSQGNNYTYQWTALSGGNFVSPTNILSPQVNEAGSYQLLVTNTQNGCTATDQVNIIADANDPVVAIATPSTLTCVLQQTTLNSAGSSTGGDFVYNWSGPGLVTPATTPNAQVNTPGSYILLITNTANGCESVDTVNVAQNIVLPVADAGLDDLLNCYTPQDQIGGANTSSGTSYTYAWNGPGIVGSNTVISPVISQGGTYTLVVTNTTNGCTHTDAVLVNTDFALPSANAGSTFQLTCTQTEYTMGATGSQGPNFTYEWTTASGNFVSPTNILNPIVNGAGQYYLEVTNTVNGCTQTADVQITQAADVPTSAVAQPGILTCSVQSLSLSGAGSSLGSDFTYLWSTSNGSIVSGYTTLNPVIEDPGTYALAVTNTANNCTATSSITVLEDVAKPNIDPGTAPELTCTLVQVNLAGEVNSNGNFTYQWEAQNGGNIISGANSLTPIVSAIGTYVLNVTNTLNGCSTTESMVVTADVEPPVLSIATPNILTCTVLITDIDATASGNAGLTYLWTGSNGGNIVGANNANQAQANEPGTYTLLVTNSVNGCTATQFVQVQEDVLAPIADAGTNDLLTCAITSLELNGDGSSQNGDYFYQWVTSNGQILVGANSLTPTVVAGGTYQLNVVNNANGCKDIDEVLVTVDVANPTVAVAAPGIITCTQPTVTLNGAGSQGGSNISYAWSSLDGNIVSGNNTNTAVVNASGEYILSVLNTQNGCTATQSVNVSDNIVLPNADAGNPATLTCTIEQVTLQGAGSTGTNYSYSWVGTGGGAIVSGANTLQPIANQPGIYTLTVLNTTTGCKKLDEVEIFEETNKPTDVVLDLDKPSCKDNDGVITFSTVTGGVGPYLYSIDGGTTFAPTLEFTAITPGNYDLWIQDVNGCEYQESLVVPKAPDPIVNTIPEFNISLGDSLQLKAELGTYSFNLIESVLWTPEEGLTFEGNSILQRLEPYAKPFKTTTYLVTIISKDGCKAEDRVLIRVDDEPQIYIPNVFTPNQGENNNNIVLIFAKDAQVKKVHSFQIFDRWGEMVFQDKNFLPNDPAHGWDGRINGKDMMPAVFVYWSEIELIDGRRILYKGDITLVR